MVSTKMPMLLVVEDDKGIQKQLKWSLEGYSLVFAEDRESAICQLRRYEPAVVTLDLGLEPDPANASEGFATLSEILSLAPSTKIIVVTGSDDRQHAMKAVALGAYDYYQKPIEPEVLSIIIDRAYKLYSLEKENQQLSLVNDRLQGIIGDSPAMQAVCRMVERVAANEVTTLLLGESGTGKEVFARAIHRNSNRRNQRFVAINCASIPESLLESELFGYEKGAFTGAHKKTIGKVEYAQGGTLFLDEIGDMPQALQAKLLRFLQEKVIEPVGGREEVAVDVRVICATNKDIAELASHGQFREDLYYRISEITINIPPLRERGADVVLLARTFLHQYNQEFGHNLKGFSEEAIDALCSYAWPGNVRELQNKIKGAVIMADGQQVAAADLGIPISSVPPVFNLRQVREDAEVALLTKVFSYTNNNVSRAAELLGVTRPTLYALMEKYNLVMDKAASE